MARNPASPQVKSRLGAEIGTERARTIYQDLLTHTVQSAHALPNTDIYVAWAGMPPEEAAITLPHDAHAVEQRGPDLGSRLGNVLHDVFGRGHEVVMIINSDSPGLPRDFLRLAAAALTDPSHHAGDGDIDGAGKIDIDGVGEGASAGDRNDAPAAVATSGHPPDMVFGPAFDGGYYLIGTSRATWTRASAAITRILAAAPTGTATTLDDTCAALRRAGLSIALLPYWIDVDTATDLVQAECLVGRSLGRAVAPGPQSAPSPPGPRGSPGAGLREVYLHVTNACAGTCPHCYNRTNPANTIPSAYEWHPARERATDSRGELTTDQWCDAIDQAYNLRAESFVFIGGDPFRRRDLFALIEHATSLPRGRVRVFLNTLPDRTHADRLARAGRGTLTPLVSIDGVRDVNDRLRGQGNYSAAVVTVRWLQEAGLTPVVNTVLLTPVVEVLPAFVREVGRLGVTRLHLILPHARGGLSGPSDLIPSGAHLLDAFRAAEAEAAACGILIDNLAAWRSRFALPRDLCSAGISLLAIDPSGLVHACPITCGDAGFVAGNLLEEKLGVIWRDSPTLELLRASHARTRAQCAPCAQVDACGGECWVQAHYAARAATRSAGYLAPFPYCDLVRPVLEGLRGNPVRVAPGAVPNRNPQPDLTPFDCI